MFRTQDRHRDDYIEGCFDRGKGEAGMADYEVRNSALQLVVMRQMQAKAASGDSASRASC